LSESRAIVPKSEIFLQMDILDQQQIVAAATGAVIEALVYKVKGKTAISWAGINHISFFMGDIEVDDWVQWDKITMFGDRVYWAATIRARNMKYGLSSLGTAEAPELADTHVVDDKGKWVKNPDGSWEMTLREDPHCRRKALSMAQRNGKRAVIPAAVLEKWLEYFLNLRKGKIVDPPFQPKYVDSTASTQKQPEKKTTEKKTHAKVGPPPQRTPPKPAAEEPKKEEPPQEPPRSVEDVTERIAAFLPGHSELVVVSDRGDYYRVGRRRTLDREIDDHLDFVVSEMGGEWDNENNEWRIKKEAEGG